MTDLYGMIVCDRTFVSRPGRFLHDDLMVNLANYYRSFHFQVEPSRNRDFQRIREEANSILKEAGGFSLYSNARILEQAVRPVEQKIHIQQMLMTPLSILLCAASAVVAVLLCTGFSTEVFLRLFWGGKAPGGLAEHDRLPAKLSGGEQRVAIARCLAAHSQIIAADESTGNLDEENARAESGWHILLVVRKENNF